MSPARLAPMVTDRIMTEFRTSRRTLLAAGLALPTFTLPGFAFAASSPSRQLAFYHTHTGESLNIVYREGNEYLPDALDRIDAFLRDFRTGEKHAIDPMLLDQLFDIQDALATTGRFEIISGYRSPRTNHMLRRKSGGVYLIGDISRPLAAPTKVQTSKSALSTREVAMVAMAK